MKVYSLSDLHLSLSCDKPMNIFGSVWDNYLDEVKSECDSLSADDILLIAGDISWAMTLDEAIPDLNFIGSLGGKKIIIRGNHDYWWKSISAVRSVLPRGVYALQNDCIKIDNVIFAGSRGWATPEPNVSFTAEDEKIYNRELIRLKMGLCEAEKIRSEGDKLIALIHFPPFNSTFRSTPITDLFEQFKVDAVVYGHLHGRNIKSVKELNINGICYYLTSCDILHNRPVNIRI